MACKQYLRLSHLKSLRLPLLSVRTACNASTCSSDSENVAVEKQGKVCLIGLNRPHARNAVNIQTARELQTAFCRFEEDEDAYVAILYGKGGTFCAGWDLKQLSEANEDVLHHIQLGPMGPTAMQPTKPVIGAVSGYAVAGGLELSLLCDLRVAEKSSVLGIFNRRFGVPLVDGCTIRLPRLIGLSRALDLILTGRPVNADEALQMGLVNRVVPDGQALEEAIKLANQIASFPQKCMRADRHATYRNTYGSESFDEAMKYEFEHGMKIITEESIQGATRFAKGAGRKGSFEDHGSKL